MPPHVPADPKKDDTPRDLTFNGLNGSTLRTQIHPNPHAIRFPEDLLQNNVSDPRTSIRRSNLPCPSSRSDPLLAANPTDSFIHQDY